jgi:hypothetical protein
MHRNRESIEAAIMRRSKAGAEEFRAERAGLLVEKAIFFRLRAAAGSRGVHGAANGFCGSGSIDGSCGSSSIDGSCGSFEPQD